MEGKYFNIAKIADKPKTAVYSIVSKSSNDCLGVVQWHPSWRQYCFFPSAETVWSHSCLQELNSFIYDLNKNKKNPKADLG